VSDEVTEEEVFEQSQGGHGQMTAYWLVYVSDADIKQMKSTNVFTYDASVKNRATKDLANKHIYGAKFDAELIDIANSHNQ
jgi:hypothetical protein